jgi:D-amino peptidase
MRIYMSVDMEGIGGVVHGLQTDDRDREYDRARRWMTQEVNAAIEGAAKAGGKDFLVNDSHGNMRNIMLEDLNPEAKLLSGVQKPLSMMEGVERGFDAAFLVGYHGHKGTTCAILDHTYSGTVIAGMTVNGVELGETGLSALVAGHYGVPIALVTGDIQTAKEAKKLLGDVEVVAVKEAVSRVAAINIHPSKSQAEIRKGAERAVKRAKSMKPFTMKTPHVIRARFTNTGMVDNVITMPGVKRIDGVTLEYVAKDAIETYKAFTTMVMLGWAFTKG